MGYFDLSMVLCLRGIYSACLADMFKRFKHIEDGCYGRLVVGLIRYCWGQVSGCPISKLLLELNPLSSYIMILDYDFTCVLQAETLYIYITFLSMA